MSGDREVTFLTINALTSATTIAGQKLHFGSGSFCAALSRGSYCINTPETPSCIIVTFALSSSRRCEDRPPTSVEESVDFEERILAWYDSHLKKEKSKIPAGT